MSEKDTLVILGFPDFDQTQLNEWIKNLPDDLYIPENIQFQAVPSDISAVSISKDELKEMIEEDE